jgi:ubiquinone/menaquinone biosynthesis C-methylase UbiE
LVEFTGERVIPGQVNENLWSEHLARYAFARRYVAGKRVLDAGCGTGYGSAELARSASSVTGVDRAPEAIAFALENYSSAGLHFCVSTCTAMPFSANAFDVVVAFEVIEHLPDYRAFLDECARVLRHQGVFIVSSPNKRYYAESRAQNGPNPYHEHEFEAEEFVTELRRVFSNVRLLLQNWTESFAFHSTAGGSSAEACIVGTGGEVEEAHFLVGLCSFHAVPDTRSFVYVPRAANLLREREQHIGLLEQEIARTKQWLAETQAERDGLIEMFRRQKEELEERNRWADQLNTRLASAGNRIVELQNEAEALALAYQAKITQLEEETRAQTEWALNLDQALDAKGRELLECIRLLETAEATVEERTRWAQRVEAQRQELAAQLDLMRASRWLKLGRKLGLGPVLNQP